MRHAIIAVLTVLSVPIYCSKKPPFMSSHREKGMEGVLEVVE